jgi:Uma2 family endonuclease
MEAEPILLIEILSPGNEIETWANIWTYTTISTVMEILIVSSIRVEAELLRRHDDGTWPEAPEKIGAESEVSLESIGFTAALRDFYRTTALTAGV